LRGNERKSGAIAVQAIPPERSSPSITTQRQGDIVSAKPCRSVRVFCRFSCRFCCRFSCRFSCRAA
jgi:hypothetical protein